MRPFPDCPRAELFQRGNLTGGCDDPKLGMGGLPRRNQSAETELAHEVLPSEGMPVVWPIPGRNRCLSRGLGGGQQCHLNFEVLGFVLHGPNALS